MAEVILKMLSSMEKCFLDDSIADKQELTEISMLKNERLSFQLAYTLGGEDAGVRLHCDASLESPLADKISISKVESVPVTLPAYPGNPDPNYLKKEPGLYPDLLLPFTFEGQPLIAAANQLRSYFFTIEDPNGIPAGEYPITVVVRWEEKETRVSLRVKVIDAMLPESKLFHTEWFHNDCIATYYGCEIFSERHWELIGNYMEAAVKCGMNMILTPVLTPPLDTGVGRERPTVQLVDVTVKDQQYSFGYEKLDRYLQLALDKGFQYFEISHLFSQWGAAHAPKVMATVEGEYQRIFGWDTDATGAEYSAFIQTFTAELLAHLKAFGVDTQCFWHISDEPNLTQLESYRKAKALVADILKGYTIMDALSSYEFYETDAVDTPIPASNHIETFLAHEVPELWTYYCCGQGVDVSNRFLAMPGQRTRILGAQLFKFRIAGFLQWGFNFWYSQYSIHPLNPYVDTCGDYFVPAGDAFMVYPGNDGKALYTLHAMQFFEALQDLRAMELLASKIGHDAVVALLEDGVPPITFSSYPTDERYLLSMREKINAALEC